jgi:hypothetical protein
MKLVVSKEIKMTEKLKKIGIIKGLELFQPNGNNQDFFKYLNLLTQEARDYIIPFFGKMNMIKQYRTRSGKYMMHMHEHQIYTKEKINALIKDIDNNKVFLP